MQELPERISADRAALGRVSTTERVADVLRQNITEGAVSPGERLSEEKLRQALPVSRNTLREAFRLLCHEGLLVHEFNRGVFVRELTAADVADLYRMRQALEGFAVRRAGAATAAELDRIRAAVEDGERAAREDRWRDVGTANMRFHLALTALARSPRLEETMRRLLAEGRLAFHAMRSWRALHEPFLTLNRTILRHLERGEIGAAEAELIHYLDQARDRLVDAFGGAAGTGTAAADPPPGGAPVGDAGTGGERPGRTR
jgi:DNA-binding GntR family transcriptional regulator